MSECGGENVVPAPNRGEPWHLPLLINFNCVACKRRVKVIEADLTYLAI